MTSKSPKIRVFVKKDMMATHDKVNDMTVEVYQSSILDWTNLENLIPMTSILSKQ